MISLHRNAIEARVFGYLSEIDQALRGTTFGESMIGMFARIKAKESSNIEDVSATQLPGYLLLPQG